LNPSLLTAATDKAGTLLLEAITKPDRGEPFFVPWRYRISSLHALPLFSFRRRIYAHKRLQAQEDR
jgi:hypothetical protein